MNITISKNKFVFIFIACFINTAIVQADAGVVPQGNVINESDIIINQESIPTVKFMMPYQSIKADLDAGQLNKVTNSLKYNELDDETKRSELEQLLKQKKAEAEKLFEQYLALKKSAGGDIARLQQAKATLADAQAKWTDKYSFKQEQRDIDHLIAIVERGDYEEWKIINDAETEINKLIKNAKACNTDDNCIKAGFGCPFGCGTVINKSSLESIKTKVDEYHRMQEFGCVYDCYIPADVKPRCIENQCKLE